MDSDVPSLDKSSSVRGSSVNLKSADTKIEYKSISEADFSNFKALTAEIGTPKMDSSLNLKKLSYFENGSNSKTITSERSSDNQGDKNLVFKSISNFQGKKPKEI
jgi:hypothetical protein